MTHSSTKTKLIAAITVLAVMLACVFAAVFYTRTGEEKDAPAESGESATTFPLDYGDPVENTVPSGATAISNADQLISFINGTDSYGYLTTGITLHSWPYTDRVIESNQTLDGRGKTITIVNDRDNLDSVYNSKWGGTHIVKDAAQFEQWWGNYGDNSESAKVTLPGGQKAYGVSDLASANYGTIKNLKVVMNGYVGEDDPGLKDHIVTMREDGHVAMGVLAGYNAGSIINCSVTVNDKYGIVPSPYAVVGYSNIQKVSYQGMTAVGGIAGYNSGNILGSSVSLNADIGIFRSRLGIDTSWPYDSHERVLSLSTESSSVGGVAGINDGGTISGINAYGGKCWVYNDAWHNQTSYSGLVVGLGNATATNATYKLSGAYGAGVDWTIRPGTINNLTLSWHGDFSFASESYATNATIDKVTNYGTSINNQAWYAVGTYVGIIGGRLGTSATNTTLANYINVYNTNFGSGRWNYNPWALGAFSDGNDSYTVNINTASGNRAVPLFGYGDGGNNYIKTVNAPTARFDGQIKAGNNTNILTQGATATYIWSGEVVDGVAYAGLLQNIDLNGIADLSGRPHNIYQFEGYAGGTRTSDKGFDNIYGDDLGDSHLLRLPVYTTGGNIDLEYRYALTCTTLPDADSLDAFFGVNESSGFGYAYANAVILNADNTVSGELAPSGSRVFPSWKTLDGKGHRLTVTSSNAVSGSGAQVTTGGQTFNAYGDFISINYGTINNVVFRQIGGGERAAITVSGNVAYGNVVGVNNGTMNAVYHNNAGGESLRTVVTTSGAYLALGGVAGINLGTINDTASIVWNDFQGSAQTGTFVGGVVGLNMGDGTLRNVKIDGVATATMKASDGEAYLGGVLGLGANGSNGGRTVGGLSVTSSLTSSPFENWFFAGKQTLDQTSGAYVGMLAGGVTSDPTETDRPLLGMIVLMPDTQYDLGWFTDRTNTPSLLGRSNSTESKQVYIATSMVGGYSVVAQDASNLYISAAISDYNGSLINGAFSGTFAIDTTYIRGTAEPIVYYEHIADVGATVSGNAISVPSNASGLSVIDNTDNPENYAQTIALRYVYEIGIDQTANDADGSTSEHALRLFLSGDALGAGLENYPGSYKAIAAGATSAVITSDLTLSADPNGIVFAAPKTSLNGGGHTVTISGNISSLQGGATYELGGAAHNVYGELVAINRAEIKNVKLNIAGNRSLSGDNVVYGAIGVNVGGTGDIGNEVRAYIDGVDVTWAQNVSLSGGGDQIFGGIVGIAGYPGNVDNSDLVVNGNVSLTGSYYRANVGAYGYIFGGSVGGLDGTKATWMGDVTMTGADNANVIFGGVAATFNTGNLVGASATFGSTSTWQGYLDGHLYDKAFDLTVTGGNVMAGGVVGHMPGNGNLKNSSALFNVDFDVVQTGAAGDYNVDVGGVIGQITAGTATSATVSGLGALAVQGTGTIRMGGAVGAAGSAPTLTDVKAMLAGGLYNRTTPGDYGWWSGYNEGGVTVNGAVFAVHDGKEYSAENAYGGSPKTTTSLGGGYRITDASDRDVDYLAINPNGMTAVNMGPAFAASWNFGSASAVTVAVTDGTITEYKLSASVNVYTNDNYRDEYMLRSALAGVPYADVTDPSVYGQSKYRYYGWYAGAQTVALNQSNEFSTQDFNIYLYDTKTGFVWGAGRTLEGNSGWGYKVTVAGAMNSNIAPQEMIWREESGDGTTEVVNSGLYAARGMFLAVNYGTVSNVNVIISNGTSGGGDITIDYATVMENAENAYPSDKQGVPGGYAGVIFGMLVGVNAGTISGVNALSYDRVTTIKVTDGYADKDLVVGGMVGAQIGADSSIGGAGTMTFGDGDGIAVTGTGLNRISVGGWIGMVSNEDNDTSADGLEVVMKAYSFIDIEAPHNFAALGGIVGDLRGVMSDARIDTEYLSRMLVGGTRQNGTAALGNLVGVANGATIERAVVKGVGYLYNGIDENSAQQSSSVDLYSGGAIGLASNWAQDTSIATNTYKRINPSTLDSIYVDFEGYLRAVNGSKVGLITGRLFDGVTVGADGTTVTKNIDATKLSNIVWKVNYYGDVPWASSAYIGNVSTVFNERTELAVYGYAAADVDGYHEGLAKSGMRLWVTNNRYSGETNNEIDAEWTAVGKLKFTITNITGAADYESFTAYFNGATGEGGAALEGKDGITRLTTYHSRGSGAAVEASAIVDVANRLTSFTNADYSHGVYVIRFIFKEVYIYNQAELMTFITEGRNTVSNKTASTAASALTDGGTDRTGTYAAGQYGLAKTEARYNELKNADIGVLANNIEVNFGATAATMPSHKTLDGQGFTVTLTASGQVTAHQMWSNRDNNASDSGPAEEYAVGNLVSDQENVRSYVSGGKEAGTTGGDYVTTDQGSSHFDATTLDQMTNTEARVGATIGGLFMGRNLGTIANINFVLENSVTVFNDNYGSLMVAGIVTAVNAGTIENCSLTLGANANFRAFRDNCSTKDKTNNTDYGEAGARINSVATVGGYAGMMFKYEARSANTAYIRNSTLTLESGSMITVDNEFPTYTWIGMYTSVASYSGGLVGWMLNGGEIYNVILNGEGDVKALASFEGRDNIWNSSYMVGVAGIIVGMNAVYPVFNPIIEVGHTQDNFGYVNGVICNWNGNVEYNARYSSGVGGSPADYYDANHWNYSLGGQMIGVSQTDTIQNVYFMYGVENYATYHRDNWWYGDSVAARAANESFRNKYDYVVSQSIKLLNEHPEWDAIYAPVNKNGPNDNSDNNFYGDELVPVAHRVNGEVVQGADFTFENYNNYHSANSEANESIFKGVEYVVDNDWGFKLYKTDLDANGQPTYYGDITRSHYHKIVELYPDTQADDNKSHDMVGARTSGRFAYIGHPQDYSYQYAPNNVYIYEVAFGESEARELDMNDPNTVASMSFETEEITSDIRLDFQLYTDENLAQFVWSIEEEWDYTPESGIQDTSNTTNYYNTVNSLEEAMRNNKFDRTMRRDNDSVNIRITYWVGSAVAIAPDMDRYSMVKDTEENEDGETIVTSLTYYDKQPYIYSNSPISPPVLYYVNAITGERINDTEANINTSLFTYYKIPGGGELASATPLGAAPTVVGEYFVRLDLGDGPGGSGDGLRVNYTDRTVMFGVGTDHYDFYTAILPYGVTQGQVESITKTYDGTTASTEGTVFELASSLVGADELKIKGVFEQKDVGDELDFTADSTQKAYVRTVGADGKTITLHAIPVFTAVGGSATNYAWATATPVQNADVTANLSKYSGTSGTTVFRGKGVINPYLIDGLLGFQVQVPDPAEDAVSGQTVWETFNRTPQKNYAEYMAGYTYTTAAFANSTLTIGDDQLKFDTDGTIDEGLLAEDDEIVFVFAFNGNASASDKGEYSVTLTMTSRNYAFSGTAANAVKSITVGDLVITEISLDSLAYFVYNMNDIEYTFNGAAPSATAALFGGSLVITDRRGHTLVQGKDYTSVGLSYEIVDVGTEVGEYALRVTITDFDSFNYVLDPNTVYTFSPKRTTTEDASLFIIPKEIRFDSVVKEFDNTGAASSDTTKQNFTEDYAPIAADSDYFFEGKYATENGAAGYTTIGEDKDFEFDTTALRFTINGAPRSFNILSVEGNNADGNYYIADPSVECGGITPIEVVIESARMQYNSRSAVDYTAADTAVEIVRAEGGVKVDIQPKASFDSPRTGTGKTVTVEVTSVNIYGTPYDVLQNSDLSDIKATSGVTYSGNYCVDGERFTNVGEIFQYTIEWEHFNEVLRVNQVDGSTVADFITFAQSGAAADSLTYKRGYAVEGVIEGKDNDWPNDDDLAQIIVFEFTKAPDTLGYAGEYTLSLTITGVDSNTPDYVWGEGFNKSGDAILFTFEVEKQVISASATASSDPEKVTYNGSAQNIQISASVSDNDGNVLSLDATPDTLHNDDLNSTHTLGDLLPIGDYSTTVEVKLVGDDALNYTYNKEDPKATFSVLPAELTITSVTKEYDATTAIDTPGNVADFDMSGSHEPVELDAEYASKGASSRVNVLFAAREINIGGSNYFVFLDRDGNETNYCASDNATESGDRVALNVGVINKYVIGSGEISSSVNGWVGTEREPRKADGGSSARFEYRDNGVYSSDDVVVNLSRMRYGFTSTDGNSPVISDGTTLSFNISIEGRVNAGSTPVVLTVGDYEIVVTLDNSNFELAEGVRVIGKFTIVQQSVSGGEQDPDNPDVGFVGGNVLITADRYSYTYGEGGFNLPAVDDAKVVLKVTVYDAYSGVAHEFEKEVVGQLLYGADKVETLDGDVLVGDYVVWATAFQDELDNYVISSSAVLPVFVTGTTIPDDAETTEEGTPVGVPHEPIYSILPATAEINSVVKTYDGTTSFAGATKNVSVAVAADEAAVVAAITGSYLSPDATHGTDESLTGNGSLDVNIDVHEVEVGGKTYYVISVSGVAANYTVNGTVADNKALVAGVAKIYRLVIDSVDMMQVASAKFGKTYDGSAEVTRVPEMTLTVTLPDVEPLTVTLTPTAAELAFTLDGEEAAEALHAGAYGVAIVPEGMDNFEIAGGAVTVPVNGGAAVYFVAPRLVTIDQFAKTYDGTSGRTDATVVVNTLVGEESEQFNISFADAAVGLNKTIVVATETFTSWDGSTLKRILNLDGTASDYAVAEATLSGSGYTISPAVLTLQGGANKTYDGDTTIDTAPTTVFGGFVNGETISPYWHYDSKDAGTRAVLVRVDTSIEYVVGESVYYAVFTIGEDGSLVPGNYGVSADGNIVKVEVEVPPTEEGGEATIETYYYMQFDSAGTISVYQIGAITSVRVDGQDISVEREYDRSTYSVANVAATVTIGGASVAVTYATGNTLTATTPFGDTLTFNAAFSPTPVQDAGSYTLTISLAANNNYSMSGYTGTFVIVKTDLDSLYIVIPEYGKTYDGTSELPSLDTTGWLAYGKKGVLCFDFTSSVRYDELVAEILDADGAPLAEGDLPVNVRVGEDGAIGGYAFRLSGVTFENKNYIWDGEYVVNIVTEFDFSGSGTPGARTLYTITPKQLTVNKDSLKDKTFDGAFSLSVNTGIQGEYAIVGDANGAVGALAGVYGGVTIAPRVLGVTFDSTAANPTTNAANYAIEGGEVTIESLTIGTGNVLTAERALGEYRIGFGGMAGLDFLAGAGADEAAIAALVATAESGALHADGYTAGDPVALLNAALVSLFEVKLNTAAVTLEGGKLYFNDFLWSAVPDGMGRTTYALTFSFSGIDGYDADGYATDRYEFVIKGATAADVGDYIPSTNASLTSSELAPGQLAEAVRTEGTEIATADKLLEFLKTGGTGYLTADIYGFDAAGAELTFGGTLYGNGHTIQLTPSDLEAVPSGGYNAYGALVAVNNGTIRDVNLKLMGCDLAFEQSNAVFGAVGVNNDSLINVGVEIVGGLVVDGAAYVGGLAGVNAAGGTITDCAATVSGAVNMTSTSGETVSTDGTFGGLAGRAGGAMNRVAAYGSGSVSATVGGAIVGAADGLTMDGVIAAADLGINGVAGSGTPEVSGLYVNTEAALGVTADALGTALVILEPHTEGIIAYYFTSADDFTTGTMRHNEFGSAGETNMSGYTIYSQDANVIAVEAIAPAGRYVWEGYGINYRTVGTALNRIVGVFAIGTAPEDQYNASTQTITQGVNAYTVAFGIYGSTIVAEDTSSVKEVIYDGNVQSYRVTLTVDGTPTEIEVAGTDVGYYSRSFVEGVISGGESVGNITFDTDGRLAITITGGSSVSDGIALIIHPKTADATSAEKFYDGNSEATVDLEDSTGGAAIDGGVYLDAEYVETKNAADATQVSIVNATTAVRRVVVDQNGNFAAMITSYETVDGQTIAVNQFVSVTIGENDDTFRPDTVLANYTVAEIMRAYAMLTDYADIVGVEGVDTTGYTFADVFAVTGVWSGSEFGGTLRFAPGEGNLIVTDEEWTVTAATLSAQGYDWSAAAQYTVAGTINPINLNIGVTISGADQSYRYSIDLPTTSGGAVKVNMTFEEAAKTYGLTQKEYDDLCLEAKKIEVDAVSGMFKQLIEDKIIEERDGKYWAVKQKYAKYEIDTSGGGTDKSGNFIVGASGMLTLRYFKPDIDKEDGKTTYLLGSLDDWRALQSNEKGTADYNTLDYRLTSNIDFGGEGAMLAWRTAEGNMLDFTGTLDGGGYVLSNIFEFNEGTGAKSALIGSIGEGGVVKNLTVVDSVFDAFGDNTVTAGIAIENHGTIENCTFEGTLAGGSKTAGAATLAGLVANNFGTIKGGVAVADGLIFAAANGKTDAVGVAFNRDNAETEAAASVESSNAVAAIRAYGGASGTLGGAVEGSNAGTGNGYVQGLATRNGAAVADADTSSDGMLVWRNSASVKAVIEKYVFNTQLVGYNGTVLDTDNFRKLIAAIRLFEFVTAADVTHTGVTAWGKYAVWLAAHTLN